MKQRMFQQPVVAAFQLCASTSGWPSLFPVRECWQRSQPPPKQKKFTEDLTNQLINRIGNCNLPVRGAGRLLRVPYLACSLSPTVPPCSLCVSALCRISPCSLRRETSLQFSSEPCSDAKKNNLRKSVAKLVEHFGQVIKSVPIYSATKTISTSPFAVRLFMISVAKLVATKCL